MRKGLQWVGAAAVSLAALTAGCDEDRPLPFEEPAPEEPAPTSGTLLVTVVTTGASLDEDGYQVKVDGQGVGDVGVNQGEQRFTGIAAGTRFVELDDVAANCSVEDGTHRLVTIEGGRLTTLTLRVRCEERVARSIQPTTPILQHADPQTAVSIPPGVLVLDQNGIPLSSVAVDFGPTGGGSVGIARAPSDQDGLASCGSWLVNAAGGEDTLVVNVEGLRPVRFYARAAAVLARYDLESIGGRPVPRTYSGGGQTWVVEGGRLFFWNDGTFAWGYIFAGGGFDSTKVTGAYQKDGDVLTWSLGPYNRVVATIAGERLHVEYEDILDFEEEVFLRNYGTFDGADANGRPSGSMTTRSDRGRRGP